MAKKSKFAMAGQKRAGLLAEARKAEPSSGYNVPDGTYMARVEGACDVFERGGNKGAPYVRFVYTIVDGDYEGVRPSSLEVIGAENEQQAEIAQANVIKNLKTLLPDMVEQIEEVEDFYEVEELVEELTKRAPLASIAAVTKTSKKNNKDYQSIYINKFMEDDHGPPETEDGDSSEEDEEGDEDEKPETDSQGEGEEEAPAKGDWFAYKPPRKRNAVDCEVKTVNQSAETVTLEDESGKQYKAVPWGDLGEKYEDD